jgi:hypothetical protein
MRPASRTARPDQRIDPAGRLIDPDSRAPVGSVICCTRGTQWQSGLLLRLKFTDTFRIATPKEVRVVA